MATLKAPFALDRSLNTTELTPRNIADVLAEGFSHITGRTASEVEYDNTDSGLTADNVQDALDEIVEDIPTVPTVDIQTAVDEFETYNGGLLSSLKVSLSPNQDLHGYDSPWVGGVGKNKLENSYTTQTLNGITFTVYSDGTVMVEGGDTATANADCILGTFDSGGVATILNGCPSGGSSSTYMLNGTGGYSDTGDGVNLPSTFNNQVYIRIRSGYTIPSGGLLFKPMIRLATESDPTFEPYSNICPISGHTQVDVGDDGKNRYDMGVATNVVAGITYTRNSDGTYTATGTATGSATLVGQEMSLSAGTYMCSALTDGSSNINASVYVNGVWKFSITTSAVQLVLSETSNVKFHLYVANGQTVNKTFYPMIRLASDTDPTFVPYNGYQVTVNLGGTYYSGTLEVVSGELSIDGQILTNLENGTWQLNSTATVPYFYSTSFRNIGIDIANRGDVISDSYKSAPVTNSNAEDGIFSFSGDGDLRIRNTSYGSDINTFKASLSSMMIWFPLATPTPIQLSPTMVKALVGENHLSAPLEGQEITESKYKQMFTFDDVIAYIQSL